MILQCINCEKELAGGLDTVGPVQKPLCLECNLMTPEQQEQRRQQALEDHSGPPYPARDGRVETVKVIGGKNIVTVIYDDVKSWWLS